MRDEREEVVYGFRESPGKMGMEMRIADVEGRAKQAIQPQNAGSD